MCRILIRYYVPF
ncbi:hypothetical protein F383_38957 [Gossypium arboreum]|uniref:Uncharacterized protein n=1 Tax=Gossypium arboreum TaxID=29729 RepID=A0A0B0MI98_GOSAR|nr:hypothetical protein F383_38957 [Gossypium arboreum]